MRVVGFIFARAGSKGLPGKNTKILDGKPLIAHAIEVGKACPQIERVVVSTDSEDIAKIAIEYGADVPFMRPKELAQDNSNEWSAWQHAIDWFQREVGDFDVFVSLPPTSPFRVPEDIQRCIHRLTTDTTTDMVVTATKSFRSPYFNMVKIDPNGHVDLVINDGKIHRRQDAPKTYDLTTIAYAARPAFIMNHHHMFDGRLGLVEIPVTRSLDIDTPFDFELASFIAEHLKANS